MVTKEDGLKYAKLIHVSVDNGKTDNSNKVYIMTEQSDGKIKCEYGRVGKDLVTVYKSSHEWNKVYNSKVGSSKGYTDVTEMIMEAIEEEKDSSTPSTVKEIEDVIVKRLVDELMAYANKSIQKNYKVTQDSVTELQISSAQAVLDEVNTTINVGVEIKKVNDLLLRLYTIIPRKMTNVKDYLLQEIKTQDDLNKAKEFLNNEQDTLDTMAGQVKLLKQQKQAVKTDDKEEIQVQDVTILDQMGIKVEVENNQENIDLVKKLLGPNAHQCKKIFKVTNTKTQQAFDGHLASATVKKKRLYWHGSRNENWFNILQTGLMIRPSGAVHTGSMFGDGIYFADKAQKSIGYSSLRGSYWAHGGADKGFLALFDVHLGVQKDIKHHTSSCYTLCESGIRKEGFDSVFAHGGADLRNNEFIVYNRNQCTVSYLIELQN